MKSKISGLARKTLLLAAMLLVLSVFVRLLSISNMAVANEPQAPATLRHPDGIPQTETEIAAIEETLRLLQGRKNELDRLAASLDERADALTKAEDAFEKRKAELEQVKDELRETIALAEGIAESDLAKLTTVYENMKAKDAARLFAEMDATFAAGFISRMRPERSADILAGMDPAAAYAVSAILAGRNLEP